jgi:phosphoribosylaminoimidazole-succinocarboxamide synthase
VLSRQIPFKGQVLTQIAWEQGNSVRDIMAFHGVQIPDPQVMVGVRCEPYDVEFVIRGYLTGSLWRLYQSQGAEAAGAAYGIILPEGMRMNQQFPEPIVTPTTKAQPKPGSSEDHHDEPVSRADIVCSELVRDVPGVGKKGDENPFYIEANVYDAMIEKVVQVYSRGQEMAGEKGLLLVDTKYELGRDNEGCLFLIDEVNTPDSSRFWYLEGYDSRFESGESQKSMSKEFVREWLMAQGYDKAKGESSLADLTQDVIVETAARYIQLYETLTGKEFVPGDMSRPLEERIYTNLQRTGHMD